MAYIFDIGIVLLLAFFAWRGAAKGLIMSLCGLAAVFVAFFAAQFISDTFCAPVAGIIRPIIEGSIQEAAPAAEPAASEEEQPAYTLDELLKSVKENGLFEGFTGFMEQGAAKDDIGHGSLSPVNALAGYLSKGIAKALLFGLVFVGIQLAWFLLSHALDLAFKLPILSQVNLVCGLLLGLVKGVLLIIVLVWLGQLAGAVPSQPDTPVLSLFTVDRLSELLASLPA